MHPDTRLLKARGGEAAEPRQQPPDCSCVAFGGRSLLPSHFLFRLVSAVRVAYLARSLTHAIVSADEVKQRCSAASLSGHSTP